MIFEGQRSVKVCLDPKLDGSSLQLRDLIRYIVENMIRDEKDVSVFIENGTMCV